MDVVTQRRCLTALAGSLLLGAAVAGAWSLSSLPEPRAQINPGRTSVAATQDGQPDADDSRFDPSQLSLKLRQPLEDPPPPKPKPPRQPTVAPKPAPPKAPQLNFTLLATIIDPPRSVAVIADPSGSYDQKGVGESLTLSPSGVSVVKIEVDQVTLAHNGKESTIIVDKKSKGGGGRNRNQNNRGRNNR